MARTVYLGVRMAVLAPLFLLYTIVVASIIVTVALIRQDAPVIQRIILAWSRMFLRLLGSTIETTGRDLIDPDGQYVFVANHVSNGDIPAMFLTAPVPIRYLAKKEVYKIPMVGLAMRKIGMVKVDRNRGTAIHSEVNAGVAAATRRGHSLIIFPEGTRSIDGTPAQFKKGAFRIAISNQLPVVPVTIEGTWEVWRPGAKSVTPGSIRTVIHEPIPTEGLTLGNIDEVRARAQDLIVGTWESLRSGKEATTGSSTE